MSISLYRNISVKPHEEPRLLNWQDSESQISLWLSKGSGAGLPERYGSAVVGTSLIFLSRTDILLSSLITCNAEGTSADAHESISYSSQIILKTNFKNLFYMSWPYWVRQNTHIVP